MNKLVYLLPTLFVIALTPLSAHAQSAEPNYEAPQVEENATQPITEPEENDVVDTGEALDVLFERLRKDIKPRSAGATANMIWREWSYSGSKSIDLLMNWAARAMRAKENAKALDLLDQVVTLAPDYSEAYNRRATLYYSMANFSRSLADIEKTLALEPRHFGALSGLAAILQRLDREPEALETWYRVLQVYPANKTAQTAVITLEEKLAGSRI